MKRLFFLSLLPALSGAQTSVTGTTAIDINGNRVTQGPEVVQRKSATGSEVTEKMQSINGRMVPLERVEERIVKDDASGRIVERLIRRYDPQGNPAPSRKETIEEQKRPDGSTTTQTSTYQGDINGRMQLVEKSVTQSRASDSSETAETVIQRPVPDSSVDTVEKRSTTKTKARDGSYQEDSKVYRKDGAGGFYTAVRQTTEHSVNGPESTDNTAEYELGSNGQLQLHGQTVSRTVTQADGSKNSVVDIFGQNVPGTVDAGGSRALKLQERQIIQTAPGPNNTVVETLSVRRPTVSDPNTLGPERQLSQTVCKGDCKP